MAALLAEHGSAFGLCEPELQFPEASAMRAVIWGRFQLHTRDGLGRWPATQEPGVKIELAAEGCECAGPSFCAALRLGARSEMQVKKPMHGKWLSWERPALGSA